MPSQVPTEPQTVALALLMAEPTDRALKGWMPLPRHIGANEVTAERWVNGWLSMSLAVIG